MDARIIDIQYRVTNEKSKGDCISRLQIDNLFSTYVEKTWRIDISQ